MDIRLKSLKEIEKRFGLVGMFESFANSAAAKKNPKLLAALALEKLQRDKKFVRFKRSSALRPNYSRANFKSALNPSLTKATPDRLKDPISFKSLETQQEHVRNKPSKIINTSKNNTSENTSKYCAFKWKLTSKNRYYSLYLQPTLLGEYSLTRSWGSYCNNLGNYKTTFCDSLDSAHLEIKQLIKQRQSKGYEPISV